MKKKYISTKKISCNNNPCMGFLILSEVVYYRVQFIFLQTDIDFLRVPNILQKSFSDLMFTSNATSIFKKKSNDKGNDFPWENHLNLNRTINDLIFHTQKTQVLIGIVLLNSILIYKIVT